MQADRVRRTSHLFSDDLLDTTATIPISSSATSLASSSSSDSLPRVNYIEHRVSKMDTLPGVAIKYGVEVADIKRLNGLTTDIQMFARKTLQIPLPGRHPPSPCLSNGSIANGNYSRQQTSPHRPSNIVLDLFHSLELKTPPSKVSPAMSSLQAYYGITPPEKGADTAGAEMAVYKKGCYLVDEPKEPPFSDPLPGRHRKSISLANGFPPGNGEITKGKIILETAEDNESEKPIRRRQKNDASASLGTTELLLEDNSSDFPARKGKGLAMRPKLGSHTDVDMGHPKASPHGDCVMTDGFVSVRKSSSTSSLQDSENHSSIWLTSKWTLNPELLARPLFDGLPKPIIIKFYLQTVNKSKLWNVEHDDPVL
ncbi:hypothetical protein OPV22_001165 [Ensete ventricosum]|uniref:LysM domain-containing protein n=1 Tax=Ensete ventricosum TaxID=4639 RepID=A0AAV8RRS8_ENSVE|nr:hypothetical protein OPV22_001165 [Ensete ventricosum]